MRFGLGQFTLQIPPWDERDHATLYADALDLAVLAEAEGLDSFWLAEHHGASDGYNPSVLPFLAAVSARTQRIELGTAVLLAPFHDPLRVAEDAAVVDNLSGGRLNLGLGLGWAPEEYRMFGVDQKGRGKRLEEFVSVLRGAWRPGRFTVDGAFYSYEDVAVTPKPARPTPLWMGGGADAALRRAARIADGYFPPSTAGGPDQLAERAELMLRLRHDEAAGAPFGFGMFLPIGIGEDADDAWASIADGLMHVRGSYMLLAQNQRDLSGARDAVAGFAEQIRASAVVGTPQEVAATLAPMVEKIDAMGFERTFLSAGLVQPGMSVERARAAIEAFAREVVPALR